MDADYYFYITDRVCCVIDKDTTGHRSVTNDALSVVRAMMEHAADFDRLIYRDSSGIWDEMEIKDGEFNGFLPIGERTVEAALRCIREERKAEVSP